MDCLKSFLAVVIVCIDDYKRCIENLLCRKHSLTGSPRLCTTFRQSSRNIVNILESVVYSYIVRGTNGGNAITNSLGFCNVKSHCPFAYVLFIEFYDFFEVCDVASSTYLPHSGKSRLGCEAGTVMKFVFIPFVYCWRAGSC